MSLGILWGEWIAQPPEHRALYLAVSGYRRHMDAVDEGEAAMKQALLDKRAGRMSR